ncbi:MAG: glycoside hydrolase family 95-like protein [Armatimonadota bacterium]
MRLSDEQLREFLARHDMIWTAAPRRWDSGIPLGNGHIGALLWGDGAPLKITLDKYDCWELREQQADPAVNNYAHLRELVEAGAEEQCDWDLNRAWRRPELPHPTRLPMPRVEIDLPGADGFGARLDLYSALVSGLMGEVAWSARVDAGVNLLLVKLECAEAPPVTIGLDHLSDEARQTLATWGYEEPQRGREGEAHWLRLRFPAGGEYVVAWEVHEVHHRDFLVAIAVLSHNDAQEPLVEALRLVREAPERTAQLRLEHAAWWPDWWRACFLTIPDPWLENLFYVEMYKLGCCSRPGGLPITLQGLWTADGAMPPWSGDYHLDMNVQESYWPVYASNHLDAGLPLYQTFSRCLPRWRQQCRSFFGFQGLHSGCAIGPGGERIHGYHGVEFWPGNVAWLAHHYWLHWLYSRDDEFLREQALPIMRGAMETYMNLLEEGDDGRLHVPLGYSPEWGEGSIARYAPDPNCDLALIRWLGQSLLAVAADDAEAPRWRQTLERLVDYPVDEGGLMVTARDPLFESHRHHSHLMAIHPLGTLHIEQDDAARSLIGASITRLIREGHGRWTGWSWPWASLIASRAGLGNMAYEMLRQYRAFVTENSFHINGDPRIFGLSHARYSPMTLEAGFAAAAAIMEVLLQSWAGTIRVFPSVPDCWGEAYFEDLRAEGAFLVSALRTKGEVRWVRIRSEAGEPCRLRNPWPGREVTAQAEGERIAMCGGRLTWATAAGREYLIFPSDNPPTVEELQPTLSRYDERTAHWFGVQLPPRF